MTAAPPSDGTGPLTGAPPGVDTPADTGVVPAGDRPPLRAGRRLHPLTPLLRGWRWLLALVAYLSQDQVFNPDPSRIAIVLAIGCAVGLGSGVASWWTTRYGFEGDHLRIDTGVLFRRSRRVRLDRLQAVDVVRPLLARAVGLSELRLEVAGGGHTEAPLAYLSETDAQALRAELLARAAGLDAGTPEAPERTVTSVGFGRLLGSTLLSSVFVVTVLAVAGVAAAGVATGSWFFVATALPGFLALGGVLYDRLVVSFGFTLSESPDGLRIRKGLLATRAQTVPPGRVQGVALLEPLLWRAFGWVRLEVDVAGYRSGGDQAAGGSGVLLPVASRDEALDVLERVLSGARLDRVVLEPAPRAARWLRPLGWRYLAAGADDHLLVTREGVLTRRYDAVPHAKTQSVRLRQGPVQRRLGLADVHVDTTPGPVDAVARHRPAAAARSLADAQAVRARSGRRSSGPERWMAGAGKPPAPPDVPRG